MKAKRLKKSMVDHFDFNDRKINTNPPYTGQAHTDYGERGKTEIKEIKFSDLYQAVSIGIKLACVDEKEFNAIPIDVEAVAQNISCEVEKLMGIYPNIGKKNKGRDMIRPELIKLTEAMEAKLKKNDYKTSWKNKTLNYLVGGLLGEVDELRRAFHGKGSIADEAVDVANFAMMIYNKVKI